MLVDTEFNYVELDNLKKQPKLWVETIVFIILFPPIVGIASKVHSIIGFVTANLYLLLVVIFFARKFDKITQFNETVLATFAQQNNSTFQKIVDDDYNSYSGSIFQIGHSKRASYLIRRDDTDLPFKSIRIIIKLVLVKVSAHINYRLWKSHYHASFHIWLLTHS